jgi:exodeoxyribonuclease VII large subunit
MENKLSLSELQHIIRDSLYMALPDFYWVTAEISEIKVNSSGHCYLELIEKPPDDKNVSSRIKAIIWSKRYWFLRSLFENVTGAPLREGMKILVKVKIEYHEIYGLSLIISDIDPSYTAGEMAIRRQMIIRKLEEEGVFSMNRELDFPVVPQRIAVISSKNAAGYSDFIKHLKGNNQGFVFYTALFETVMQGNETEKSVIGALDRIADQIELFDLVAIIRGGGSQSDLSWFDNYNIAFYVTQFPLPVITGIGHEKDLSVTDLVANMALKTPTAVADYLVNCLEEAEKSLKLLSDGIASFSASVIEHYRSLLESSGSKLIPLAKLLISAKKKVVSDSIIELINYGKDFIIRAGLLPENQKSRLISSVATLKSMKKSLIEKYGYDLRSLASKMFSLKNHKMEELERNLSILDPVNVLKRGFTITTLNGIIVKSSNGVAKDDFIDTIFSDGRVKSKVMDDLEE